VKTKSSPRNIYGGLRVNGSYSWSGCDLAEPCAQLSVPWSFISRNNGKLNLAHPARPAPLPSPFGTAITFFNNGKFRLQSSSKKRHQSIAKQIH